MRAHEVSDRAAERPAGAVAIRVGARPSTVAAATLAVFGVYQVSILCILAAALGGLPNYLRLHAVWDNARRVVRLTPSTVDTVVLLAREPLVEYGRRHPEFGVAVWSFELTWSSLFFFVSFSGLVAVYFCIGGRMAPWRTIGSLSGAGIIGLLGAGVSSLTHCGIGSFGVVLAVVGISTSSIQWSARFEPVLIPLGYSLIVSAILMRANGRRRGPAGL